MLTSRSDPRQVSRSGWIESRWRLYSALLVVGAAAGLAGAFTLPFIRADFSAEFPAWIPEIIADRLRQWLIETGGLPVGDQYLWGVIQTLWTRGEYFVGLAIFFFSVVFPAMKVLLCALLTAASHRLDPNVRRRLIAVLAATAKWSMADVFIVGMIIVFFKAEGFHFTFTAKAGIYSYTAAALLSSAAVSVVQRIHKPPTADPLNAVSG